MSLRGQARSKIRRHFSALLRQNGQILELIDNGTMALPEFQRGYIWNRDQVSALSQSLYRRYPVGSLLVWMAKADKAAPAATAPSHRASSSCCSPASSASRVSTASSAVAYLASR